MTSPRSADARLRHTIVTITSGKGGVGKTSLTVNLAASLSRLGHTVGVLDADFGLGNLDVMLGLAPGSHLGDVLDGSRTLDEVLVTGPDGIRVAPAGSGIRALTSLTPEQLARLQQTIVAMAGGLDFLLVDSAPGIGGNVLELAQMTDYVIVLTSPEPTAIVDAYAVIKLMTAERPDREVGVVVNGVDADRGQLVYRQLETATRRFLSCQIKYYGYIAHDPNVAGAVLEQRPVVSRQPESPASRCFRRLAIRMANWPSNGPIAASALVPSSFAADTDRGETMRCA